MTDAAITEFLAAFSRTMLANPYIRVVEVTRERLLEGLALYKDRPDSVLLSALA